VVFGLEWIFYDVHFMLNGWLKALSTRIILVGVVGMHVDLSQRPTKFGDEQPLTAYCEHRANGACFWSSRTGAGA
jgi:hypothetical protein